MICSCLLSLLLLATFIFHTIFACKINSYLKQTKNFSHHKESNIYF